MGRSYCTVAGMNAAHGEYEQLRRRICKATSVGSQTGANTIRDSELDEAMDSRNQLAATHQRAAVLAQFINDHQPFEQKRIDKVRFGNLVTAVYDDEAGKEQTKVFVIGAAGEPEIYKDYGIDILSCESPFAAAFLNKEIGDTVKAKQKGHRTTFEITAIGLPSSITELPKVAQAA